MYIDVNVWFLADPECASDVGVLQCPSIEVTPSTTTTRNKIPNKSDQQNMSLPEQGAQRGEDKQEGTIR